MEQKKTYRTFQFGNVVAWRSEFRGTLSASEHRTVEVGNPRVFKFCRIAPADKHAGAITN